MFYFQVVTILFSGKYKIAKGMQLKYKIPNHLAFQNVKCPSGRWGVSVFLTQQV